MQVVDDLFGVVAAGVADAVGGLLPGPSDSLGAADPPAGDLDLGGPVLGGDVDEVGEQVLLVGPVVAVDRAVGGPARGEVLDEDAELAQGDLPAPELEDRFARGVERVELGLYRFWRLAENVEDRVGRSCASCWIWRITSCTANSTMPELPPASMNRSYCSSPR